MKIELSHHNRDLDGNLALDKALVFILDEADDQTEGKKSKKKKNSISTKNSGAFLSISALKSAENLQLVWRCRWHAWIILNYPGFFCFFYCLRYKLVSSWYNCPKCLLFTPFEAGLLSGKRYESYQAHQACDMSEACLGGEQRDFVHSVSLHLGAGISILCGIHAVLWADWCLEGYTGTWNCFDSLVSKNNLNVKTLCLTPSFIWHVLVHVSHPVDQLIEGFWMRQTEVACRFYQAATMRCWLFFQTFWNVLELLLWHIISCFTIDIDWFAKHQPSWGIL